MVHHRFERATRPKGTRSRRRFRLSAIAAPAMARSCVESLEPRTLFAGVTLITHGYEPTSSARPGWLDSMADAIVSRAGSDTPVYDLRIALNSSGVAQVMGFSQLAGPAFSASSSGDAVVLLDWADASGLVQSYTNTTTIAQLAEPYLVNAFPSLGINAPLADEPIHLIGHSRGGSVVSELAGYLGQSGIWVDQLTTLDPHPVSLDPSVNVYDNVLFADNYYETDSVTPGQAIAGAHNIDLSGVFPSGLIDQHADVHAYYDGTIDQNAANDGDAGGPITIDPTWYNYTGTGPRDSTGFYYSQIGGGVRPADGVGAAFGGSAVRVSIANAGGAQWANIDDVELTDPGSSFQVGQTLHAQYLFQDDSRASAVSLYLDSDQNPFDNSPVYEVGAQSFAQGAGVLHPTNAAELDTSAVPPGQYYLVARITDGQTTRYAYANAPISLTRFSPTSVAISGFAYQDLSGNGFSSDDTPLGGMTIGLYQADGATLLGSTTTAADGSYSFEGLTPGSYIVRQNPPNGWTATGGAGGYSATLTSGQSSTGNNFDDFQAPITYLPDLTASIVYSPQILPPGGKRNPMVLDVSNTGNLLFAGRLPINVYASQGTTFDGSAVLIASLSPTLRVPAGGQRVIMLSFNSPADVPNGNYYLLTYLNEGNTWQESDYTNNTSVASSTTTITQPFVDIGGAMHSSSSVLYRGRRGIAIVTLTNGGNVPASGVFSEQVLLSPDDVSGAGAVPLGSLSRKMTVMPGRSVRIRISFAVPSSGDGAYLEGIISYSGALSDSNISNNTFFSDAPVTLAESPAKRALHATI